MSASNPGPVRRFFRGVWRVVDVSRRVVLNLIFLLILAIVVVERPLLRSWTLEGPEKLPPRMSRVRSAPFTRLSPACATRGGTGHTSRC